MMNDANDPWNDEAIEDLLGPLRAANPPDGVCSANREAIHRALNQQARPPWWQCTVAVPMPLAIAASLALLITAAAALWPAFGRASVGEQSLQSRETVESDTTTSQWRITYSYIRSLESLAEFQNSFLPETTEDRHES